MDHGKEKKEEEEEKEETEGKKGNKSIERLYVDNFDDARDRVRIASSANDLRYLVVSGGKFYVSNFLLSFADMLPD